MVANTRHRILTLVAFLAAAPQVARADSPLWKYASSDAAVLVHAELGALEPLANVSLRPFGITFPVLVERAIIAALGWSPLSQRGWETFGVTGNDMLLELSPRSIRILFSGHATTVTAMLSSTPILKPLRHHLPGLLFAGASKIGGSRFVLARRLSGEVIAIDIVDALALPANPPAAPSPALQALLSGPALSLWASHARADALLSQPSAADSPLCASLQEFASRGPIEGVFLRLSPAEHGLDATLRFVARGNELRSAFARKRSLSPRAPTDAVAAGTLALAPTRIVAALPRPLALQSLENFRKAQNQCGPRAHFGLLLFDWPAALALFFDELGRSHENAARVLRGAGTLVVALKTPAPVPEKFVGVMSLGLDRDTTRLAGELLVTVFGAGTSDGKTALSFGNGPMRARLERAGRLALGLGDGALSWWQQKRAPADPDERAILDFHWQDPQAVTWISDRAGAPFATRFLEAFPSGLLNLTLVERDLEAHVQLFRVRRPL